MQIAILTPVLGRDGGVAAHVLASTRALRDAGHEVAVLAARAETGQVPTTGDIFPALESERLDAAALDDLLARLRDLRPDVIHVHDVAHPALVAVARRVAPVVASAHGYPGCSPNTYYFRPGRECARPYGPLCLTHMARPGGCLHAKDRRPIPRLYARTGRRLEGLRAADATIAYSAAVRFNLERNELRPNHLVPLFTTLADPGARVPPPAGRTVLFAGRVVAAKGLDTLIRAVARIDAQLTVCGDGWALPAARRLAARLRIADRVDFRGWTGEAQLAAALRAAAVVAVPSLWPEPFGLVGLEAMTYQRPVVASRTGGIPEWLEDGRTGHLVEPGDVGALAARITRLLDDPAERARLGEAGRRRALRLFTPEAHVTALESVYRGAAGAG